MKRHNAVSALLRSAFLFASLLFAESSQAKECKKYNFAVDLSSAPLGMAKGDFFDAPWSDHGRCLRVWSGVKDAYLKKKYETASAVSAADSKKSKADIAVYGCSGEKACKEVKEAKARAQAEYDEASARSREANAAYASIGSCECVEWGESNSERMSKERKERDRLSSEREVAERQQREAGRRAEYEAGKAKRAEQDAKRKQEYEESKRKLDAEYAEQQKQRQADYAAGKLKREADEPKRRAEYETRKRQIEAAHAAERSRREAELDQLRRASSGSSSSSPDDGEGAASYEMRDPLIGDRSEKAETTVLVDPWGGSAPKKSSTASSGLIDPFANPSAQSQKQAATVTIKLLDAALTDAGVVLDRRLAEANRTLSARDFAKFKAATDQTKDVAVGMGSLLKAIGYAEGVRKIGEADTATKRQERSGELAYTFAADLAKYGFEHVAPKLLGPRVAAVFSGPVAAAATVIAEVLTPEQTSRDFTEIINDRSGRVSLADKQEALRELLVAYEKFGKTNWNDAQKWDLLQLTERVYRESH